MYLIFLFFVSTVILSLKYLLDYFYNVFFFYHVDAFFSFKNIFHECDLKLLSLNPFASDGI